MSTRFLRGDNFLHVSQARPQIKTGNGTVEGATVNVQSATYKADYQEAVLLAGLGDLTSDGSVSVAFTVEDSADGTNWTQVTDEALISASSLVLTAENTNGRLAFRLSSLRQYVRGKAAFTFTGGTTPTVQWVMDFIFLCPQWDPAS